LEGRGGVINSWSETDVANSDSESECGESTKQKDKRVREREDRHKTIYIGSSHNTGVVQSPYTSKGISL